MYQIGHGFGREEKGPDMLDFQGDKPAAELSGRGLWWPYIRSEEIDG